MGRLRNDITKRTLLQVQGQSHIDPSNFSFIPAVKSRPNTEKLIVFGSHPRIQQLKHEHTPNKTEGTLPAPLNSHKQRLLNYKTPQPAMFWLHPPEGPQPLHHYSRDCPQQSDYGDAAIFPLAQQGCPGPYPANGLTSTWPNTPCVDEIIGLARPREWPY